MIKIIIIIQMEAFIGIWGDLLSLQVPGTFKSILGDFNNTVVCMVSILTLISNSGCHNSKWPMFTSLYWYYRQLYVIQPFQISSKIQVYDYLSDFFSFHCGPPEQRNPSDDKFFFFLLINTKPGLLVGIRWPICIGKFQRILWVIF